MFNTVVAGHAADVRDAFSINAGKTAVEINTGILQRTIRLADANVSTANLSVGGSNVLARAADVAFSVSFAEPNQRPKGLAHHKSVVETAASVSTGTDSLRVQNVPAEEPSGVKWVREIQLKSSVWAAHFDAPNHRIVTPKTGVQRVIITSPARNDSPLNGLQIAQYYEIYEGFPVIRKWVEISNSGKRWLKLNQLIIDDLEFATNSRHQTPLTPGERGAGPSVIAFGTQDGARGVIAVSEIPSALRQTRDTGAMGYSEELFEWVLGPGETFRSEPVFLLAYNGAIIKTASAISTPRDRAVEKEYLQFLREYVGVAADHGKILAPQWCSWSNFGWDINDANIREQAELAARCGFELMLLDSGWQKDTIGTEADPKKFPDFQSTCRYIRSLGLELGLWVSCFRVADSSDMRTMPEARSVPLIKRDGGFGMSFASPWKKFYSEDLARMSREYGVNYFKQDYTNIKFGDLAEGHESRTLRESYLRGLRGLLEAQDMLRELAPSVTAQITHEIYWGTPGVPCDVAALKHGTTYHIPPNDYSGVGNNKQRVSGKWPYDPEKMRQELITGCFNARQRFYAHRGLPLYGLEYYGAHTVNFRGSLTPEIQDRQVCSWLMGAPAVFAGDLASLTEENIKRYRRRFDLLRRLEKDYDIYRHFQFSGVPAPTDTDWHWWGKLNGNGEGAVVVIRGKQGSDKRVTNIPWVHAEREYEVTACFLEKSMGKFKGSDLQHGALQIELPPFGQEILELKLAR